MEKLKKPEVKSYQSKHMQRRQTAIPQIKKKGSLHQTEVMKCSDMDEEDDDDDDEDSPLFGEMKMDQKKTDQKKKFSRGSVQLPNTAPKEKKDS